jgi:hypothetical protein
MSNYSVYLGAVGWSHARWESDFYPEDLPKDWQLAFYSTQFRCVYLPYEMWRSASDKEVADWLHETRDSFHFVLQRAEGSGEQDNLLARRFGERGIPDSQINLIWLEGDPDLRSLARSIQEVAQKDGQLYLISRDAELTQLRQVSELMDVLGI